MIKNNHGIIDKIKLQVKCTTIPQTIIKIFGEDRNLVIFLSRILHLAVGYLEW